MVITLQGSLSASAPPRHSLGTVEGPESQVFTDIPIEYQEFQEVFSKAKASGLPPHMDPMTVP